MYKSVERASASTEAAAVVNEIAGVAEEIYDVAKEMKTLSEQLEECSSTFFHSSSFTVLMNHAGNVALVEAIATGIFACITFQAFFVIASAVGLVGYLTLTSMVQGNKEALKEKVLSYNKDVETFKEKLPKAEEALKAARAKLPRFRGYEDESYQETMRLMGNISALDERVDALEEAIDAGKKFEKKEVHQNDPFLFLFQGVLQVS